MKHKIFLIVSSLLIATMMFAQEEEEPSIPLIGDDAPAFTAVTTNGTINFPGDYGKNWKILFSHPMDFTPVCSSELLEIAYQQDDFEKLGVKIAVVSADDIQIHKDWKKSLESLSYQNRDPVTIQFPLIDDQNKVIAREYGMMQPSTNSGEYIRGVFIISPDNKIRAISFNPMEVGRNIDEIKRVVIALQATESATVFTPANWDPGEDVLVPHVKSNNDGNPNVISYNDPYLTQVSWYMTFKKMDK